ncbi:hypothetical protein Enr13x_65920 [Stieleria neptunia]|uniref:PEP-CTERM protein-sorting domain-containing protein n=1 Tax=Stieleria neptunia TaxID=2527979 RepID=A0A518I0P1_9BACT|nr:DUF4465 domain-containing protein [Stieleria neptunia]QDV46683.1 hypothetical protein Enr13x_65920 [Stieleria neptunia]
MNVSRPFLFALFAAGSLCSIAGAEIVTFENLLTTSESYYKGDTSQINHDPWTVDGVEFSNQTTWVGSWGGWAYSNTTDTATPGFTNEHSAITGGGSDGAGGSVGGQTYALAFGSGATINLPTGALIESVDWTNGTYPYLSMRDGDAYAKEFGGGSGSESDFFRVTLTGYSDLNATGAATGTVTLDLADYTFADDSQDYIVNTWQVNEDLTALGNARSIDLTFQSSDVGQYGINTPTYLFIDNLQYSVTAIPEPTAFGFLALVGGVCTLRRRR